MFPVPDSFTAQFGARDLELRRPWLAALSGLAGLFARRWSLRPDGPPSHGFVGVVWPVLTADGTQAILKLSWPHDEAADEGVALHTWAGGGAARLLDHDPEHYALLLERLDPNHSLNEEPIDTAVEVAGGLLRRLAVPAPPTLHRHLPELAADLARRLPVTARKLGDPIPRRLLSTAVGYCRELGPVAGSALVNEDGHYLNVLRGDREPWLLIDPKPLVGDVEFGVIPLLWNRFAETPVLARFDAVVAAAGLDVDRARAWTLVRAVQNWLWALPGDEFPLAATCVEIAERMLDHG
jgi:streptomycin 6-kinase